MRASSRRRRASSDRVSASTSSPPSPRAGFDRDRVEGSSQRRVLHPRVNVATFEHTFDATAEHLGCNLPEISVDNQRMPTYQALWAQTVYADNC